MGGRGGMHRQHRARLHVVDAGPIGTVALDAEWKLLQRAAGMDRIDMAEDEDAAIGPGRGELCDHMRTMPILSRNCGHRCAQRLVPLADQGAKPGQCRDIPCRGFDLHPLPGFGQQFLVGHRPASPNSLPISQNRPAMMPRPSLAIGSSICSSGPCCLLPP